MRTKINGRTEGDKRDEPDTATPMVAKHIIPIDRKTQTRFLKLPDK